MFLAKGLFRRKKEPIENSKKNGNKAPTRYDLSAEELLEEESDALCFIFDLEGAIVDTHSIRVQAWKRLLTESKIQMPSDPSEQCYGTNLEILQRLTGKECSESDSQELSQRLEQLFTQLCQNSISSVDGSIHKPIVGLQQFLEEAQSKRLPLAVISDANQSTVEKLLKQLELDTYFNVIISGEDVERGKPYPDTFLKAALRLGKMPEECITFVNSNVALEAAYRAKMKTFAIRRADTSITPALSNIVQVLTDYQNLQPAQAYNYTRLIDILSL